MARILGLDLGSHRLKAVVLDSSRGAQPLEAYFSVARPKEGDPWDTLRAALTTLLEQHSIQRDQVVVSLPGPSAATHTFTLPFSDAKRLEAALPFEVEGQLPFELSEIVYDYQLTAQTPVKSELLVGIVRRDELATLLQILGELQLDPRIVTHPALAYQSLWLTAQQELGAEGDGPCAIVDLGHERTHVAIGLPQTGLVSARTFAGGGRELTKALAQELQVSLPEANHWKEQQAVLGGGDGADSERISGALVRGLQPILRELRATFQAHSARTHAPVARILLCGGTSRLPGITEQLTRDLGIPTELLPLPEELESLAPDGEALAAAQAYALALRGKLTGARAPRFNFRRGAYAFRGHLDYLRVRALRLGLYAAALVSLFIIFGMARNSVLSHREAAVDAQLCKLTQSLLGRCEKNYDRALNLLKGKDSPSAAVPKVSAVNLLAELSQRIPPDIKVTFDQILVDPDRVSLRGTTDSSKQIDRITQALKAFRCFKDVQVGKLDKTKDHVNFSLDVQVECPDQAPQANAG